MRIYRCVFFAALLAAIGAPHAFADFDMAKVTCHAFMASGKANMEVIIMWLRGYHAGKSGTVAPTTTAQMRAYGGRLGYYCKNHPNVGVIDASEKILSEEDRGI